MRTCYSFIVVAAMLAAAGCVDREAQVQAKRTQAILGDKAPFVTVLPVVSRTISETLEISGQTTTSEDASVGAKISGRLVAVYVKDGDLATAGQVIAQQDASTIYAQLRQAQGQLAAAQAQLSQAISNSRFNPQRTSASLGLAEAQLRSAKAQLQKARRGARSEEVTQAEIQVRAAKSAMETAKSERDRKLNLYNEGAVSRQQYEVAENAYQQALAQYESALEGYRIRQGQTQPEDLRSAEEAVRQAEENVRNARAQKSLDVTLGEQVAAARAQVSTAQAGVDLARQNLADATIRSPFTGRVSGRPAQIGTVLAPGATVARLIGSEGVYFEGQVPERQIADILPGKQVQVRLDAIPNVTFVGKVASINPLGDSVSRQFRVRITLTNPTEEIRPGMFARGLVTLRTIPDATLVPSVAIVDQDDKSYVFVEENGIAKRRMVMVGARQNDLVQITPIAAGERVIVKGQDLLKDGEKVKLVTDQPKSGSADKEAAGD